MIKRYKLLCPGMLVTALICQVISLLMLFTFFVHCPDPLFAGVNVGYDGSQHGSHFGSQDGSAKNPGSWAAGSPTLNHSCNSGCSCSRFFQPVCYEPLNLMYFSSCRAGCMTKTLEDGKVIDRTVNFLLHLFENSSRYMIWGAGEGRGKGSGGRESVSY